MYTNPVGFDSKPFKPRNPREFYHNADFDAACAAILRGIRTWQGFILLTGEAGLGKTLVLRRCMAEADEVRFVLLGNAHLDFPDILNYLCADLGLRGDEPDFGQQGRLLQDALAACAGRGQVMALLIDDAHHLRVGALQQLWAFMVETAAAIGRRPPVVLAGLPDIEGKLRQPELRLLRESIQIHHRLERLSEVETGLFIAHQLKIAGQADSDLLEPAVVDRIARYCQGVPQAIALLCDTVLLFASLQAERQITPATVDEAARSCFLGDPAERPASAVIEPPSVPNLDAVFDLTGSELSSAFDFDMDETSAIERPVLIGVAESQPAPAAVPDEGLISLMDARPARAVADAGVQPAVVSPGMPAAPVSPLSPPLRAFLQLLAEIATKLDRKDARDREAFQGFRHRYQWLSQSAPPGRLAQYERRMARLAEGQQAVLVALATSLRTLPEPGGILCALLLNPSWWLYREIRVRLRSDELAFANSGQAVSLRLLDGRDAQPVYLEYRLARAEPGPALLQLELDLLDHRGVWHAYRSPAEIRLNWPRHGAGEEVETAPGQDRFWPDSPAMPPPPGSGSGASKLVFTLPLELEVDDDRTHRLRTSAMASSQALGRGTALTRALLLGADSSQAPARIELVSRPFIILGRYNPATDAGFGDFALGFVPEYARISRLHAVICALGDQLALMPVSDQGRTCTRRNNQRLERGQWYLLESDDSLEVCDLYRLKLTLVWDRHGEGVPSPNWNLLNLQEPRDKFGRYLLDLVEVLRQRDRHAGDPNIRTELRNRYANLMLMQDRIAGLNGVGSPGALLYARFERDDAASRQVVHYYVPKWLSLGSSPQAGLRIAAAGVAPLHAELLFREGMYWIQNLAGPGSIQVGCHGLGTNEVLALESGDVLTVGAARFEFEAY
jgi:general secretion pathway protein A